MPLLDKALERILSDGASEQLQQMTERLNNILIDITPKLGNERPQCPGRGRKRSLMPVMLGGLLQVFFAI